MKGLPVAGTHAPRPLAHISSKGEAWYELPSMLRLARSAMGVLLAASVVQAADIEPLLEHAVESYLAEDSPPPPEYPTFRAFWRDGLRLETADGVFKLKIGGRLFIDMGWQSADDAFLGIVGDPEAEADTAFIRTARIELEGTIYTNIEYKLQYDFAKSAVVSVKDAYDGIKNLDVIGTLRIGNSKEPAGLEQITSSKLTTFMEQATSVQAFTHSRRIGFLVLNNGPKDQNGVHRLTWQFGAYRPSNPDSGSISSEDGYEFIVRLTGLAIHVPDERGARLLHLGISLQYRSPKSDEADFSSRGTVGRGPAFLDTDVIDSDSVSIVGFEVVYNVASLSVQAEAFLTEVDAQTGSDPSFKGWYVYISYFVTGEHRPYRDSSGVWNPVIPKKNWHDGSGGAGAWEIAFRFDTTDLNDTDAGIDGGEWVGYTIGVNWYWNPNARVMFNFVHGELEDLAGVEGDIDAFMMRFQVSF